MSDHGGCERLIVSSDSHVTEPADLWEMRIDKRFRERAPGSDVTRYIKTMDRLREPPVSVVRAGPDPSFGRERLRELAGDNPRSKGR